MISGGELSMVPRSGTTQATTAMGECNAFDVLTPLNVAPATVHIRQA